MTLINCPDCNRQISNEAISCPNCGKPLKDVNKVNKQEKLPLGCNIILLAIPIIFAIYMIPRILANDNETNEVSNSNKYENNIDTLMYQDEDMNSLFNSLGGNEKLVVLEEKNRCNYFKSYFILNKEITDTIVLKKLANFIAIKVRNINTTKDQDCNLPKCSNVHIYMNEIDFQNKNIDENGQNDIVYSECIPMYPNGDAWINKIVYKKYK